MACADRRPRLALAADYPWLAQVEGPLLLLPGRGTRLKGHAHALQLLADVRATGVPAQLWMLEASLLLNVEGDGQKSLGGRVSAARQF